MEYFGCVSSSFFSTKSSLTIATLLQRVHILKHFAVSLCFVSLKLVHCYCHATLVQLLLSFGEIEEENNCYTKEHTESEQCYDIGGVLPACILEHVTQKPGQLHHWLFE